MLVCFVLVIIVKRSQDLIPGGSVFKLFLYELGIAVHIVSTDTKAPSKTENGLSSKGVIRKEVSFKANRWDSLILPLQVNQATYRW